MPRRRNDEFQDFIVSDDEDESPIEIDFGKLGKYARDSTHQRAHAYPQDTFAAIGSGTRTASYTSTVASDPGVVFMEAFGQTVKPGLPATAFVTDTQRQDHHAGATSSAIPPRRVSGREQAIRFPDYRVTKPGKLPRSQVATSIEANRQQELERNRNKPPKGPLQTAPDTSLSGNGASRGSLSEDVSSFMEQVEKQFTQHLRRRGYETPKKPGKSLSSQENRTEEETKKMWASMDWEEE